MSQAEVRVRASDPWSCSRPGGEQILETVLNNASSVAGCIAMVGSFHSLQIGRRKVANRENAPFKFTTVACRAP